MTRILDSSFRFATFGMTGVEVAKSRDVGERLVWCAGAAGFLVFAFCLALEFAALAAG